MATDKPGSELAETEGKVVDHAPVNNGLVPSRAKDLDQFLRDSNEQSSDPDGGGLLRIIDQVLSAATPDAVLTPVDALAAADMVGVNLYLGGIDLNQSEYDVGSPFYVSMACLVAEDQTPVVINCGHRKVIAQCVKLREFDQFPYRVVFRTRGVSKIGGTPMLELIKWEETEPAPF